MRTPLIAGNWKMFKTVREAVAFVTDLRARDVGRSRVWMSSWRRTFPSLQAVAAALEGSAIAVAAQNLHWEREGAFTGEVSAPMVREAGARLGHHRPLRAADALRRNRRHGEQEGPRRAHRHDRRPSSASARRCRNARPGRRSTCSTGRSRRASTASPAANWPAWCSPTSRSGPSARAAPPRPHRRSRRTSTSAVGSPSGSGRRRRAGAAFSTAAA